MITFLVIFLTPLGFSEESDEMIGEGERFEFVGGGDLCVEGERRWREERRTAVVEEG